MSTATTTHRSLNRDRGPSRGGISKRRTGPTRTDRDGDVPMGRPPTGPKGRTDVRSAQGKPVPTGPRKGVSGSGMSAARPTRTARDPVGSSNAAVGGFVEIRVTGWKESKGSDKECVLFLEKKTGIKFRKPRTNDDSLLLQVPLTKVLDLLEWDDVQFASAHLKIQPVTELPPSIQVSKPEPSAGATQASQVLQEVLRTRYNADAKLLNLGNLIEDPILQGQGFFVSVSTHTKLFPALMKVADSQFTSATEKREKVHSITLESNALADLTMVTTLAQTFPELKNLSLAQNNIKDWKSLDAWRWKFRKLEQLVLSGNPITQVAGYREEARKRYPTLVMLDLETYSTPPVTAGARQTRQDTRLPPAPMIRLPLLVKSNNIEQGQIEGITFNFLGSFFPLYDGDRKALLSQFYDQESRFSLSVNTSAPRKPGIETTAATWENYIPKSRNLNKIHNDNVKVARLLIGNQAIGRVWQVLPRTEHDSTDPSKWCYDSKSVVLDDLGLTGIMICVHGEYTELESVKKAAGPTMRSFDRTFILAPTQDGGIRVVSDMMTVRAWGGSAAWVPEDPSQPLPQVQQAPSNAPISIANPAVVPPVVPQQPGVLGLEQQVSDGVPMVLNCSPDRIMASSNSS